MIHSLALHPPRHRQPQQIHSHQVQPQEETNSRNSTHLTVVDLKGENNSVRKPNLENGLRLQESIIYLLHGKC